MKKLFFIVAISFIVVNLQAQITVSSNNNVGIGTPTPGEVLELNGYIRGNSLYGGALRINTASNGYAAFGPQNSGYCHMSTDRTSFAFNKIVITYTGEFGTLGSSDFLFKTGVTYSSTGTTRMTINNSTGFVGIGTTTPGFLLDVNGVIRVVTTTYQSDARLKENIKDMSGALASMVNLKGVTYNLKPKASTTNSAILTPTIAAKADTSKSQVTVQVEDSTLSNRNHLGFLAQDVQKVFPELVYADKDGMLSVDYVSLIPVLVESIKEQQAVINDLKATVEKLKKKANIN